ncbi:type IV secretion system DNA-binding domain-containing protein [Burkholderia vietnamiensis]|uniref:type IV secretion system DNA-binding domain-containing protein n=1 Tax=Burkholderia vietnamiensis TaxID=60552 RepID=UPI001593C31D|nr:type IV secretion system DNA-binding domain-containing protein [Burkholderia vietnamiensis]
MRKINYISSPKQDDLLEPSEYRRYTNHILSWAGATFALTSTAIGSQIFGGQYDFFHIASGLMHHDYSVFNGISAPVFFGKSFVASIPSAVASYYVSKYFTKPIKRQEHVSGNFLDDSPEVLDNLSNDFNKPNNPKKMALLREGETDWNRERPRPLSKTIYWPAEVDELSMVIRGEAGSGKSVFMDRLAKEAIDTGSKVILHSIKGDEIKKLDGYCSFYVIEPWNKKRGYAIDYLSLVTNDDIEKENASIRTLANSFNKAVAGKMDFFDKGATSVTEAFVRYAVRTTKINGVCQGDFITVTDKWNSFQVQEVDTSIDLNNQEAVKHELDKNQDQLQAIKEFLQQWNTSATIYVDPNNAKTSLCVLASCIEVMRKFEVLAKFWKEHKAKGKVLDMRKWINTKPNKDRRAIILVNSNKFADVADCYISAFINLIVGEVIEESYQVPWQLHFILDEFPQLSSINIQEFLKLPDVGRGKNIRTRVAMQRSSQGKVFGIEPESLIGAFQVKIWCRMATDDLKNVDAELGKEDVFEWTTSGNNNAQGKSITNKKVKKSVQVINPNDIQNRLGPQIDKKGRFMGVSVLMKLPNNPRVALVTMPPVSFPKKLRKPVTAPIGGASPNRKDAGTSGTDTKEEIVISEMEQELEATTLPVDPTLADLAQEHQGHEHDPVAGAITETVAHAVGGEGLSAVIQAGEMLEAMGGTQNENTNIVTVEETTKEGKKLSFKKQVKQQSQSQQYNIDQELDL